MNTDALRHAYAEFLDAAQPERHCQAPEAGAWSAEMVLAHVIVGDRLIAEAAGRVMAGMPTTFDNLASQSQPYLESVVEASGGWEGLVAEVQRAGDELIALVGRMTDEQAATPIASRIFSDNAVVLDATVPVSNLVRVPSDMHLRMHLQQLAALSGDAAHAPVAATSTV